MKENNRMTNVIEVHHLSKQYRLGKAEAKADTFAAKMLQLMASPIKNLKDLIKLTNFNSTDDDILWALKEVSFSIKPGEIVGLIGSNGSGKSTLLKILSRITAPSSGSAILHGRVASLLEVGTGFHPDLTGRENVYLNGTILGMTRKEIDSKFDEIVDFSEVEKFIDTPVKRYSSGMRVRLGFSVAAHLDPHILLVDEVLAVGDISFQDKCLGKMDKVASDGRTVIFVSHNMEMIQRLCPRTLLLNKGKMVFDGPTKQVVGLFFEQAIGKEWNSEDLENAPRSRTKDGQFAKFTRCDLIGGKGKSSRHLLLGEPFEISIGLKSFKKMEKVHFEVGILTPEHIVIQRTKSAESSLYFSIDEDEEKSIKITYPNLTLNAGKYHILLSLIYNNNAIDLLYRALVFQVDETSYSVENHFIPTDGYIRFKPSIVIQQIN